MRLRSSTAQWVSGLRLPPARLAGTPLPPLGRYASGGGASAVPTIFSGALCLLTEFGSLPRPWSLTLETWVSHVRPRLKAPILGLSKVSRVSSVYDHRDCVRVERKLYSVQCTALLIEFFRVNAGKGGSFLNRFLGGSYAQASEHAANNVAPSLWTTSWPIGRRTGPGGMLRV